MKIKLADSDITVVGDNALIDYDAANQAASSTDPTRRFAVAFYGVRDLKIDGLSGVNCEKYFFVSGGLAKADISRVQGSPYWTRSTANGDHIKVYGAAFDVYVHDCHGVGYDDVLSFQTQEPPGHQDKIVACGEIIGCDVERITTDGGFSVATLYPTHPTLRIDNITVRKIAPHGNTIAAG